MQPNRTPLTPVDGVPNAERCPDEADGTGSLAHRLEEIFLGQLRASGAGQPMSNHGHRGLGSREDQIPFSIEVTLKQVLDVADDAGLRAQMLEWSIKEIPISAEVRRKVSSLREVALDLRRIATRLKEA